MIKSGATPAWSFGAWVRIPPRPPDKVLGSLGNLGRLDN